MAVSKWCKRPTDIDPIIGYPMCEMKHKIHQNIKLIGLQIACRRAVSLLIAKNGVFKWMIGGRSEIESCR